MFKISAEGGVAAGIRRIEATTGESALALLNGMLNELQGVARQLKVQPAVGAVERAVLGLLEEKRAAEKELARLKSKLAASQGEDLADQAVDIKGTRVLAASLDGADAKVLRETLDSLKARLGSGAVVLGSVVDSKVVLVAGVTPDLMAKVKAGELVNFVARQVGGKGGGRPDMAQAGGTDPANLAVALKSVAEWVGERL